MGRIKETGYMLVKSENGRATIFTLITPYSLKYPHSVMKGVGKDMHIGILPVNKPSVHPYLSDLLNHLTPPFLFSLCLSLNLNLALLLQTVMLKYPGLYVPRHVGVLLKVKLHILPSLSYPLTLV